MKRLPALLFLLVLFLIPTQAAEIELDETFPIDELLLSANPAVSPVSLPEEAVFDNDNPGYGAQLEDAVALAAYQALVEQLTPSAEQIIVDLSTFHFTDWSTEVYPSLLAALSAYIFDHPEMQYCSIISYGRLNDSARYYVQHSDEGQARKESLDKVLSDFASQFDTTLPVVEQYKAIHDYVCELASYDHKAAAAGVLSEAHTAYGLLVDGRKVVCEGYSKAFKLLCNSVGLPCLLIAGEAVPSGCSFSGVSNHMWNLVRVDDAWFAVDTTWDDVDGYSPDGHPGLELSLVCYDYFLNNTSFQDGTADQNHRSSGNIYFANSWPMTFALPPLAEGTYAAFTTDHLTLTFHTDDLIIPDILWRCVVNGIPLANIPNLTLRLNPMTNTDPFIFCAAGYDGSRMTGISLQTCSPLPDQFISHTIQRTSTNLRIFLLDPLTFAPISDSAPQRP